MLSKKKLVIGALKKRAIFFLLKTVIYREHEVAALGKTKRKDKGGNWKRFPEQN